MQWSSSASGSVAQSCEWLVCMCRSTSIRRVDEELAAPRLAATHQHRLVDGLGLLGHRRGAAQLRLAHAVGGQLIAQLGVGDCAGSGGRRQRRLVVGEGQGEVALLGDDYAAGGTALPGQAAVPTALGGQTSTSAEASTATRSAAVRGLAMCTRPRAAAGT